MSPEMHVLCIKAILFDASALQSMHLLSHLADNIIVALLQ